MQPDAMMSMAAIERIKRWFDENEEVCFMIFPLGFVACCALRVETSAAIIHQGMMGAHLGMTRSASFYSIGPISCRRTKNMEFSAFCTFSALVERVRTGKFNQILNFLVKTRFFLIYVVQRSSRLADGNPDA